jgi:hypothetical protein
MQKNTAFTAERIIWAMGKHNLPGLHTKLYDQMIDLPQELKAVASTGIVGTPVICCVESDEKWTLLGTVGIAGSTKGNRDSVAFSDVRAIGTIEELHGETTADSIKHDMMHRSELRLLKITDQHDVGHAFSFATPQELCAFFNVVLRLTNTDGRQVALC